MIFRETRPNPSCSDERALSGWLPIKDMFKSKRVCQAWARFFVYRAKRLPLKSSPLERARFGFIIRYFSAETFRCLDPTWLEELEIQDAYHLDIDPKVCTNLRSVTLGLDARGLQSISKWKEFPKDLEHFHVGFTLSLPLGTWWI